MTRGKKYDKEAFLTVVEKHLPLSSNDWILLVPIYQEASGEVAPRAGPDLSRLFQTLEREALQKPTGKTKPSRFTKKVRKIQQKMNLKSGSISYGAESDDSSSDEAAEVVLSNQPMPAVVATEAVLPSNLESEFEGNTSAVAATAGVGSKRKSNFNEDNKSKNSRNSGRLALGSLLKDLIEHMKSPPPPPLVVPPSAPAPVALSYAPPTPPNPELVELKNMMETSNQLIQQLVQLIAKNEE